MNRKSILVCACAVLTGFAASGCSNGKSAKTAKPAAGGAPAEMQLPPGWTEADMQACMLAGTPGKQHAYLTRQAGKWRGTSTTWMTPGAPPAVAECTSTVATLMDGRFIRVEHKGDMPGMGPYHGMGIYGYDNVSGKFTSLWIDNHGTGMMSGTGDLSPDGKTLTWTFTFNCPVNKKPATMKEVETMTGPNSKKLEMWGPEPKSGQVYKIMELDLTKK
jgi:hypothetical protein